MDACWGRPSLGHPDLILFIIVLLLTAVALLLCASVSSHLFCHVSVCFFGSKHQQKATMTTTEQISTMQYVTKSLALEQHAT